MCQSLPEMISFRFCPRLIKGDTERCRRLGSQAEAAKQLSAHCGEQVICG
jgi:hypothetical protein